MPNPKAGTVTSDVAKTVKEFKSGKFEYRNDKEGNLHVVLGNLNFDKSKLEQNFDDFYDFILKEKPAKSKEFTLKVYHCIPLKVLVYLSSLENKMEIKGMLTKVKKVIVKNLVEDFQQNEAVLISNYSKLSVNNINDLRKKIVLGGFKATVVKNRLVKMALDEINVDVPGEVMKGQNIYFETSDDVVALSKLLVSFPLKTLNCKFLVDSITKNL